MLTPFTSQDQVRAVLGVTSEELSNDTLNLEIYEANLRLELDSIQDNDGDLIDAFEAVADIAEASRTRAEANFHAAVVLFAPYPVALHLASSLPLFAPKSITDGKAGISRHTESPFAQQIKEAKQYHERFRQNLITRWATYSAGTATTTVLPNLFAVSSPASDPVAGT